MNKDKLRNLLTPLVATLNDLEDAGLKPANNEHIRVFSHGDHMINVGHLRDARELLRQLDAPLPSGRFEQADLLRDWVARDSLQQAYVCFGDTLDTMAYRAVLHISQIADGWWDVLIEGDDTMVAMTGDTSIFVFVPHRTL